MVPPAGGDEAVGADPAGGPPHDQDHDADRELADGHWDVDPVGVRDHEPVRERASPGVSSRAVRLPAGIRQPEAVSRPECG